MNKVWYVEGSQSERCNFDAMVDRLATDFISSVTPADLVEYSAEEYLSDTTIEFVDIKEGDDTYSYDDTHILADSATEARARFVYVFGQALSNAVEQD